MVILGVDDSATMRKIIGLAVKSDGNTFIEAENGQDALNKLTTQKVDLFLVDINMPVMGGLEFITKVRSQPAYIKAPIIIITTENEQAMRDAGMKAGANDWIVKPFEKEQLLSVIGRLKKV